MFSTWVMVRSSAGDATTLHPQQHFKVCNFFENPASKYENKSEVYLEDLN